MSYLDLNLADAQEPELLKPDREYLMKVFKVTQKESKSTAGNFYLEVVLEPVENPLAKMVTHRLMLPGPDDEQRTRNNRTWAIKSFVQAIGLDPAVQQDTQSWVGEQCWIIAGVESDPEYGEKNNVKKFIAKR